MREDLQFNIAGGLGFDLPEMAKVRQVFERHGLDDVAKAVTDELERPEIKAKVKPSAKLPLVLVVVGSPILTWQFVR